MFKNALNKIINLFQISFKEYKILSELYKTINIKIITSF